MDEEERMHGTIECLEKYFLNQIRFKVQDNFSLLIATILSQNTSDVNSHRAFEKLMKHFEIKPEILANASPEEIKPLISSAGLGEIKSKRIVDVAKNVLERFGGDLNQVLDLPLNEARKTLMSMKGVGPKTSDILLSFAAKKPVFPIDTNIFRVVNRIGFVKGRNYERTRKVLEELIPPEKIQEMHIHLIRLGREICKPRNPRCASCPILSFCDYSKI